MPSSWNPTPSIRACAPRATSPPRSSTVSPAWKRRTSLGNDLVWLRDPRNEGRSSDARLLNRVLTPRERFMVQLSPEPDRMLWSLWAAKEAAYKAAARRREVVFAPSRFEVEPNSSHVLFEGERFPVRWIQGPDWVHAVVADQPTVAAVEPTEGDESAFARAFAARELRKAGFAVGEVLERPPVYRTAEGDLPVSLSHDGPYSAVVFFR